MRSPWCTEERGRVTSLVRAPLQIAPKSCAIAAPDKASGTHQLGHSAPRLRSRVRSSFGWLVELRLPLLTLAPAATWLRTHRPECTFCKKGMVQCVQCGASGVVCTSSCTQHRLANRCTVCQQLFRSRTIVASEKITTYRYFNKDSIAREN